MPATSSFLNGAPGRPDLVVALTEASIESALRASLRGAASTPAVQCYLAHDDPGDPSAFVQKTDLVARCMGNDPFDVPDGTPYDDARINLFNLANFSVAFSFRVGIHPNVHQPAPPKPVLELTKGEDGFDGTFNMYCTQYTVVWNEPPSPQNGNQGRWHVWDQPDNEAWPVAVRVKLARDMVADQQGMYVQQVRVDLDNAAWSPLVTFGPVPDPSVPAQVLRKHFLKAYADLVRGLGQLVLKLKTLVPPDRGIPGPDANAGFMRITDFTTRIAPYPALSDPALGHDDCRALELLCAVNGRPLPAPSATPFNWAWAEPDDVPSSGGVIAVHRMVFLDWLKAQLMPAIRAACIVPTATVSTTWAGDWPPSPSPLPPAPGRELITWGWTVDPMGEPDEVIVTPSNNPHALLALFERTATANCDAAHFPDFASLFIHTTYRADVDVTPTTVVVTRYHFAEIKWHWLRQAQRAGVELHVFNRTVVDTYSLTVDAGGRLSLADPLSTVTDTSAPFGPLTFDVDSAPLLQLCTELKKLCEGAAVTPWLREEEFERLRSFVFPGAGSCTFREARISAGGDLICYTTSTDEDMLPKWWELPQWGGGINTGGATQGGGASGDASGGGNGWTTSDNADSHMDDWNNAYPAPPGPLPKVSFTSELMTNYVLGTLHSPYGKFEAVQTADGHSLIFSLTTNSTFTVLEEASGTSNAGWTVRDLSTAGIVRAFPNVGGVPRVRTFGVGQSALDGTIGVAMVVQQGGTDHLFLSLGNSNANTSWTKSPQWLQCEFDAVGSVADQAVTVAGILFAEAIDVSTQTLVVDLERAAAPKAAEEPKDDGDVTALRADPDVVRYQVDPLAAPGWPRWTRHDLPIDVEAGSYQSCVGRRGPPLNMGGPGAPKHEGTYTCGMAGASGQLVFVPLVNRFGRSPPAPAVLHLPGGRIPDAIATARNADDWRDTLYTTTDLYVVSGDTLYRFQADYQTHGSVGVPVKTAAILQGTTQLTAMWYLGLITVWGRTVRGDVYSLYCAASLLPKGPAAWSNPLAIVTGADHMSCYVNRSDGGNTMFVAADGKLQKLTRAADNWVGWTVQDVLVNSAASMAKSRPFTSYTVEVQVTEQTGKPGANRTVGLATKSRAPMYIDGRYHVLSPRPTAVTTNAMGTITVVEATPGITSHTLTVYVPGWIDTATVDPSAKSFAKLSQLNSEAALRGATVPVQSSLVAGGLKGPNPATTTLVDPSVGGDDVKTAAKNMGLLKDAYGWVGEGGGGGGGGGGRQGLMALNAVGPQAGGRRLASVRVLRSSNSTRGVRALGGSGDVEMPKASALAGNGDLPAAEPFTDPGAANAGTENNQPPPEQFWFDPEDVWHEVGRTVKGGFEDGFDAVVEAAQDGWQLVTTLGDKVYTIALSTAAEVVKAVMVVFEAIKSKIEDIIAYIMFLLEWDDISRTEKVLHNTARLYLKNLAEGVIPSLGSAIGDGIRMAEDTVAEWAGTGSGSGTGSSGGAGTFPTMDWSALGAPAGLQASALGGNPSLGQTSASQLLSSHFQAHVGGLTLIDSSSPDVDVDEGFIDALLRAVEKEGAVLEEAFSKLQSLANDFSNLSLDDVLRRIAGILVQGLLSGVGRVVDALVTVLSSVASSAMNILDAKIHFPVISDILDALGVGSLSFLDLFCWIAAVAYTITYKIVQGRAPFPDNGDTQKLIDAQSWADLAALKTQQSQPLVFPGNQLLAATATGDSAPSKSPPSDKDVILYTSGHGISALLTFIGNFLQVLEANSPTGRNQFGGGPSIVIALLTAAANGYAGYYVPRLPIKEEVVLRLNQATAGVSVFMKVLLSNKVQGKIADALGKPGGGGGATEGGGGAAPSPARDARGMSAFVNALLVAPSLFCTAWHFTEIVDLPKDNDRSAAIVEEVANLTRYTARIAYATAVNTQGQVKIAAVGVMAGATASAAGLEYAQAAIPLD